MASPSPIAPGPRTRGARGHGALAPARDPWSLHALLWLLAAGLAAFTIRRAISPHDEGLMLQAGARIAAGQWPYRDFWSNYPPGQATLLAGLDELFGVSMLSWRIVWIVIAASASGLSFALLRRHGAGRGLALLAWLAVAGAIAWPSTPEPDPAAFMLALGALLAASPERTPTAAGELRPLVAGALAGLAVFFRLEIGAAAVLGVLVLCADPGARPRALIAAVAVAIASLGPFLVAAPGAMVHDTIGFYAIVHDEHLPFPLVDHGPIRPDKLLEFYFPLLLLAAAAAGALVLLGRGRSRLALALVPLAIVGVGYLLGRTDEFHLLPLSATLAVLLAAQAAQATQDARGPVTAVLVLAVAVIALAGLDRRGGQLLHPPPATAMPGPAGDGVQTSPADARTLRTLIATVHRLVPAHAPIFVTDRRTDVVRVGDPLLYITLDRPNPTAYDVLQPGLVTTATVQRRIVADLRHSHTRLIIRWLDPTAEPSPFPAHPDGSRLLDTWIASHFTPYARDGDYEVLTRRQSG